jgi:hypothetical protein
MPIQPLQDDLKITVTSGTAGGSYELRIEKVLQVRPSDDLPDDWTVSPILAEGLEVMVLNDRPLDVDTFQIAVRAGHRYRFAGRLIGDDAQTDFWWLTCTLRDELGRTMDSSAIGRAFHAFADGVWRVDLSDLPSIPTMVHLVDEGLQPDDVGTGEGNWGHVQLGETRRGVLETRDDVDGWVADGFADTPTNQLGITVRGPDSSEWFSYRYDTPWNRYLFYVDGAGLPEGTVFPYVYTVTFTETEGPTVIPPLPPCPGDLGSPGGLEAPDRVHDNNDLVVFITLFFRNERRADLGSAGGVHAPDGWLDNNDFVVMIDDMFTECP